MSDVQNAENWYELSEWPETVISRAKLLAPDHYAEHARMQGLARLALAVVEKKFQDELGITPKVGIELEMLAVKVNPSFPGMPHRWHLGKSRRAKLDDDHLQYFHFESYPYSDKVEKYELTTNPLRPLSAADAVELCRDGAYWGEDYGAHGHHRPAGVRVMGEPRQGPNGSWLESFESKVNGELMHNVQRFLFVPLLKHPPFEPEEAHLTTGETPTFNALSAGMHVNVSFYNTHAWPGVPKGSNLLHTPHHRSMLRPLLQHLMGQGTLDFMHQAQFAVSSFAEDYERFDQQYKLEQPTRWRSHITQGDAQEARDFYAVMDARDTDIYDANAARIESKLSSSADDPYMATLLTLAALYKAASQTISRDAASGEVHVELPASAANIQDRPILPDGMQPAAACEERKQAFERADNPLVGLLNELGASLDDQALYELIEATFPPQAHNPWQRDIVADMATQPDFKSHLGDALQTAVLKAAAQRPAITEQYDLRATDALVR